MDAIKGILSAFPNHWSNFFVKLFEGKCRINRLYIDFFVIFLQNRFFMFGGYIILAA
jgi:hypothetical protein